MRLRFFSGDLISRIDKPTTLRLPKEQGEALSRLAERLGVSDASVIRWAVDALLQYAEAHDGRLVLPLDLTQQWAQVAQVGDTRSDVVLVAQDPVPYQTPGEGEAPSTAALSGSGANLRQSLDAMQRNAGAIKAEKLRRQMEEQGGKSTQTGDRPHPKASNGDPVEK